MNKHLVRILIAGAGIAVSTVFNVASGQVLGGSGGLTGSLGGTLNGVGGTLNGAGSLGGAFDAEPMTRRARGVVGRSSELGRETSGRLRDRARSTTTAVKSEAVGTESDLTSSAAGVASIVQETPALTDAAASSVDAAANATGNFDVTAAGGELENADTLTAPATDSVDSEKSDSSTGGTLIPTLPQGETSALQPSSESKHPDPSASAHANGGGEGGALVHL